jgi:hypothetical protein
MGSAAGSPLNSVVGRLGLMMYHRDGSRGKGSRRGPWREGGARKARRPEWQKRAFHAVEAINSITEPVASLWYLSNHRKNPSERIYVLD